MIVSGARADDTEVFTESEGEFLDKHDDDERLETSLETDDAASEEEHYKTPTGIPRPVLRLVNLTCTLQARCKHLLISEVKVPHQFMPWREQQSSHQMLENIS